MRISFSTKSYPEQITVDDEVIASARYKIANACSSEIGQLYLREQKGFFYDDLDEMSSEERLYYQRICPKGLFMFLEFPLEDFKFIPKWSREIYRDIKNIDVKIYVYRKSKYIDLFPPLKELIRCSGKNNTNLYVSSAYSEGRKLCLDYIDAMEYAKHKEKRNKKKRFYIE